MGVKIVSRCMKARRWGTATDPERLYGRLQTLLGLWILLTVPLLYSVAPAPWFQESVLALVYDAGSHWGLGLFAFGLISREHAMESVRDENIFEIQFPIEPVEPLLS